VVWLIDGILRELDLVGGVYPYEVYQQWPDWYARIVHRVQVLWKWLRNGGV
jgi:hypothetical protein